MKKIFFVVSLLMIFSISGYSQYRAGEHSIQKKKQMVVAKYTCSMHPDIVSDQPGKCPKCNMDLVSTDNLYTCTKHPEYVGYAPGVCPVCGTKLIVKEYIYACPMHPEIGSDSPGKCSKCGMDLQKGHSRKNTMNHNKNCCM